MCREGNGKAAEGMELLLSISNPGSPLSLSLTCSQSLLHALNQIC